jgi:ubiquinone/menaquinone biosynthesis C-methylase UbiE
MLKTIKILKPAKHDWSHRPFAGVTRRKEQMRLQPRKIETNNGIQGELTVELFDRFAKRMRDKGWNGVESFFNAGIQGGAVLEVGPGPGYVGLEWLKKSKCGTLTGLEISPAMIRIAEKNAREYMLSHQVNYIEGSCMAMPFADHSFDAAFSNGSLHEWEDPVLAFHEIHRVLKPNGIFCISDLRRDVSLLTRSFLYFSVQPKEMRPGMLTSLAAAYTVNELEQLMASTAFQEIQIHSDFCGLTVSGIKEPLTPSM